MKTARPKTETSIPYPPKKSAGKSLNISTTSDNEYSVTGNTQIPELPFQPGYIRLDRVDFNRLPRRAPGIRLAILVYVIGKTLSAYGAPEFAPVPIKELMALTGASERMNWQALADLVETRLIERDDKGRLKVCLENLCDVPLRAPRKCKPRETKEKKAAVHAPSEIAALQLTSGKADEIQEPELQLLEPQTSDSYAGSDAKTDSAVVDVDGGSANVPYPQGAGNGLSDSGASDGAGQANREPDDVGSSDSVSEPGQHTGRHEPTVARELVTIGGAAVRIPGTYCTWGWTCPILQGPPIPPTEKAYLARFLQPAIRIGELLGLEDSQAQRSWKNSLARQPDLTPRVFVMIARAKIRDWERQNDSRPGLRIRNVPELLVKSMPEAVASPRYLQACEQAPAELEHDCERARAILADRDSPAYERAWARAVLAESGVSSFPSSSL